MKDKLEKVTKENISRLPMGFEKLMKISNTDIKNKNSFVKIKKINGKVKFRNFYKHISRLNG